MDREIRDQQIITLMKEVLPRKHSGKALTREYKLQEDLGVDSMAMASFAFRLEENFAIDIYDLVGQIDKLRTVGDVLEIVGDLIVRAAEDVPSFSIGRGD